MINAYRHLALGAALFSFAIGGCSFSELPFEENPQLTRTAPAGSDVLAVQLFNRLVQQQPGNLIFSPCSLEHTLLLLKESAAGATRKELEQLPPGGDLHLPCAMQVKQAQALFADDSLPINPPLSSISLHLIPMRALPSAAATKINTWCIEHTEGAIKNIISADDITTATGLVAVNAIYLNEKWLRPFLPSETRKSTFYTEQHQEVEVQMMYRSADFLYAEGADWKAVALYYRRDGRAGEQGCFIGILPKGSARDFAASLTPEKLSDIRTALAHASFQEVEVYLPRMELSPQPLDLIPALKSLGVQSIFDPDADFSPLCNQKHFYISMIRQKCYLKADEQGTEAAAVTAFSAQVQSVSMPLRTLRFDRPFLWMIGDLTGSAAPYFMGLYERP